MGWAWDLWRSNALLALGVVLFLGGLGVPGPATVAIVAMGALIRHGGASPWAAFPVGLACAAVGDLISYGLARKGLKRWLEKRKRKPSWAKAVARFERNAPLSLFLARWLFTPISLPTTYIAGSCRYPLPKYLTFSLAGQTVWMLLFGALGYELGRRWESKAGLLIGIGVVTAVVVAGVWFARRKKTPTPNAEGV